MPLAHGRQDYPSNYKWQCVLRMQGAQVCDAEGPQCVTPACFWLRGAVSAQILPLSPLEVLHCLRV